jgi:hypothetical protein
LANNRFRCSEKGTYDTNRWKHRKGVAQGEEAQYNSEGDQAHHGQLVVVGCKDGWNDTASDLKVSEKAF